VAKLLSITYKDVYNVKGTFSMYIDAAYSASDAETLALIQAFRNMTQSQVLEAIVHEIVDISGMTNPAASGTGSYDKVRQQVILQLRRTDNTGFVSVTVPGLVVINKWSQEDLARGWVMFQSLLTFWQAKNQHK